MVDETQTPQANEGGKAEVSSGAAEDKSAGLSVIQSANAAAERAEAAVQAIQEQADRLEALQVAARLGGNTQAGQPNEPAEESAKEYADKVLRGELK